MSYMCIITSSSEVNHQPPLTPSFSFLSSMEEAPRTECKVLYSTTEGVYWRVPNVHADMMDVSPRLSYYNPTINLERRLNGQDSPKIEEVVSRCDSCHSIDVAPSAIDQEALCCPMQYVPDLIQEISVIETEVLLLERHLLSLYRTAFSQYMSSSYCSSPTKEEKYSHRNNLIEFDQAPKSSSEISSTSSPNRHSPVIASSPTNEIPEESESTTLNLSPAGHLDAIISDGSITDPCKLSQDIVKCLSSIYCKLANKLSDHDISPSASSPISESGYASSLSSSKDKHDDSWSPKLESHNSCSESVVISEISISSDKFSHASKMLEILRSLVVCLGSIDPINMEDEEGVAFWINIHNALVMHALLAYGLQVNKVKRSYLVLKAAYDVGGKSINAQTIRTSILGCESNCPSKLTFSLLSPMKRSTKGHGRHPYALSKPKPLCQFALCTGVSSDPMVRLYTAQGVYEELESAKYNYIQENVTITDKGKIMLPKLLHWYAKDASLELRDILGMVCECLDEPNRMALESCLMTKKPEKCVQWLPFNTSFRYEVHSDLATR